MKTVALLVTGKAEQALAGSLHRIFPHTEFVMLPRYDGFTSSVLPSPPMLHALGTAKRPTNVERLASVLVGELEPGRRDRRIPDVVVMVDDLELANQAHPERAIEHVRTAVQMHIERHPWPSAASRQRALDRVRERCSFHLLAPMVEAYFFAERAALDRAGAKRPSMFDATTTDVECFMVNDAPFLSPPDRLVGASLPPWAIKDRARHPKSYLQFLCDPTGLLRRAYVESQGGRAALHELDWAAVLSPPAHVQFVRSLVHDLADALGEDGVMRRFTGSTHPLTWPPSPNCLLRNV